MSDDRPISPSRVILFNGDPQRPTLVFLHGVYHGAWAFEKFRQSFNQAGYPVGLVDLRGHYGDNRLTPQSDVGYADFLEDAHQALNQIEGEKVVIGHSLGGLLAISLSSRADITKAVLIAVPLPRAVRSKQWRLLFEFPLRTTRYLLTGNAAALYHLTRFTDRYFFSKYTPTVIKAEANCRIQTQDEPARLFRDVTTLELPKPRRIPTLILVGEHDPTVTVEVGRELQEMTGGEVLVISRSGHDIMLDAGAEIASDAILKWLQ
ncbi:alpha/beta hydrolase [Rubinisphaera italica]|uniref:2-succinyl-6-hydroxy-2, 4-cyclohexadiene-1-carboxylate synthase n=1 Tax=Rubinisphaera italica TaxID=2527969 RepID=A0A5C5XMT5_9PLAN|nr:alpha/beta fold hydrolase [Rubinisphaera italica]TWT64018.1 2-succinyl-6-hydroxy-2,4-cyclohexadiene-1-carboxylate synthase [Rubinisphaera italica]